MEEEIEGLFLCDKGLPNFRSAALFVLRPTQPQTKRASAVLQMPVSNKPKPIINLWSRRRTFLNLKLTLN
ncbi:MAG: hypothetical protein IIX12_06735, partial [Alistipes sp.]|nr:hypothetical protein [Alistipes sp.]